MYTMLGWCVALCLAVMTVAQQRVAPGVPQGQYQQAGTQQQQQQPRPPAPQQQQQQGVPQQQYRQAPGVPPPQQQQQHYQQPQYQQPPQQQQFQQPVQQQQYQPPPQQPPQQQQYQQPQQVGGGHQHHNQRVLHNPNLARSVTISKIISRFRLIHQECLNRNCSFITSKCMMQITTISLMGRNLSNLLFIGMMQPTMMLERLAILHLNQSSLLMTSW
nr:adenylate cyclase, terminal-differentiation specific-like [Cherax quadricarinatus]